MAIAARVLSILLALGGAVGLIIAVAAAVGETPGTGMGGVIMLDAAFGSVVLFAVSRVLWLYAAKRSAKLASDAEQTE